jgi:tetratricopeptide (TPR) repeat protein
MNAGELSPAEATYRRALSLAPESYEACNGLGIALARQGRNDEAAEAFERAIAIDPDLETARIGILLFSGAARMVGGRLPPRLHLSDLLVVEIAAAIGFTVSLFFATAAFPGGTALAETKMGALLSFVAAPVAFVVSRVLRVRG